VTEDTARPLGEWLRQRREELDISLEQADEDTRIRARYLEALEAEDLEALPNSVVARGFLRNYAAYLELDPKEAADRYTAIAGPSETGPPPVEGPSPFDSETFRPVPLHEIAGRRSRWWLLIGIAAILIAALGVLAWQAYPYINSWLSDLVITAEPVPTQRMASAALPTVTYTPEVTKATVTASPATTRNRPTSTLEPTGTSESTQTPVLTLTPTLTLTPSPSPSPTEPIYTGIFIELVFTDTSWVQVTVDGVRQFQGELEAGTYRSWYGEERVELRVGNAGAVEITINGQKVGALGAPGEVVDRTFEIVDNEVTEATPTRAPTLAPQELTATAQAPSPTPTITPTLTITPAATLTATASP
jgi:cytoskeletal protein RodZ